MALFATVVGCAVTAPVQEMSDARQAIQAARDARAPEYAPSTLAEAEELLERATSALETGNYHQARRSATKAKEEAIRSRNIAVQAASHER